MRYRKVQSTVALLTISLLCLLSIGVAANSTAIVHFTYGSHGETWKAYLEDMAERFEAETGISVEFVVSGGPADYRAKLATMIAGGVPPDVTDANPSIGAPFIGQGFFADLRPFIERDQFPLDEMPPAALQGVTTPDGAMWGIPVSIFPVITFFNMDLFHQAGLETPADLGDDWTWDTMYDAARRLTYDSTGDGISDVYGTSRVHWRSEMQVHQAGGQLYDRLTYPTTSRYNSPTVLEAYEFLHNLVVVERLSSPNNNTFDLAIGNVGFTVVDGPSVMRNALANVPFDWGIAMQPKGPASRAARVNPDGFQILADSNKKEAAWQWVRFLTADVENQMEMARVTGRLPSLRDAMLQYQRIGTNLPHNWMVIVNTAFDPDGYAAYVLPNAAVVDPVVNSHLDKIWSGQEAPQVVLQQIHNVVSGLLEAEN